MEQGQPVIPGENASRQTRLIPGGEVERGLELLPGKNAFQQAYGGYMVVTGGEVYPIYQIKSEIFKGEREEEGSAGWQ